MLTRVHSQLLWMTLRTFDPWALIVLCLRAWGAMSGLPWEWIGAGLVGMPWNAPHEWSCQRTLDMRLVERNMARQMTAFGMVVQVLGRVSIAAVPSGMPARAGLFDCFLE